MKTLLKSLALLILVASCAENNEKTEEKEQGYSETAPEVQESMEERQERIADNRILGYYVGGFKAKDGEVKSGGTFENRITISIDSTIGDRVHGHSIVAGNFRPFVGSITKGDGTYLVEVREPGDDKYDGMFSFELDTLGRLVKGSWKANDASLAVNERVYQLEKKDFVYSAANDLPESLNYYPLYHPEYDSEYEGEFVTEAALAKNPSEVELTKEDVENMHRGDLELMRNSIYARHGYSFRNRRWRYIFDNMVDWYIPVSVDVRQDITDLEWKNIKLLQAYEDHAEEYYDVFGR